MWLLVQDLLSVFPCLDYDFYFSPYRFLDTTQKMEFSFKDFFSKYDQTRRKLRILLQILLQIFRIISISDKTQNKTLPSQRHCA